MPANMDEDTSKKNVAADRDGYRISPQLFAGLAANLVFLNVGMAVGWSSPSLPMLLQEGSNPQLTPAEGSWTVGALQMGSCFGPLASALLVDRIGRKWFLYFSAVPNLISWILIYYAKNFSWFFAARFINGLGVGAVYSTVPIYLGEIAENHIRGALGTMSGLSVSLGLLICYSVGPWVSAQMLALIAMLPTIAFLLSFAWMPETPYYYLKKRQTKAAEESLTRLRGTDYIENELKEMSTLIESQRKFKGKIWELVTVRVNRRSTLIMWIVLSAQQLCGYSAVMPYMSIIFEKSSLEINPHLAVIITGGISFGFNMVTTFVVDKLGRKPLLLISSCGTSLCLSILAAYFHLDEVNFDVKDISWISMLCVISYFIFFSVGLGPIPYALLGEIYPDSVKAWATMTVSIYGSVVGVAVTKLYQIVADEWGPHSVLYGFALFEFSLAVMIFIIVPETKGKSFKEIQDNLCKIPSSSIENQA